MMLRFLDVIVPSVGEMLSDLVRENIVPVILLLIILLVVAVIIVNTYVIKKDASKTNVCHTSEEEENT